MAVFFNWTNNFENERMVLNIATKKEKKKKHCSCCSKEKSLSEFYMSKSPLHALDGKTPLCKDCVIKV